MLSLHRGTPIAEIVFKDKKTKPKTVYVNDGEEEKNDIDSNIKDEILPKSFFTGLKNVNPANMILLKRAIRMGTKELLGSNANLNNAYDRAQELLKEILRKYMEIPKSDGKVEVVCSGKWDGHTSVMAPSGAGKSTWIANYLTQYKKSHPKNCIYVFSPLRDDPAFVDLKPQYIKIDETIIQDPLDITEECFKNSCLIFDDIESITDKGLNEAVQRFRDQVLEVGRHYGSIAVCVSHIIMNGLSTRRMLNEASNIVLFPKTNFNAISNFCRRYMGMGRDEINWVKQIPSRWMCIKRNYPTTIITENSIKVL